MNTLRRDNLTIDQRRQLETLLRHQIASVRATCALLGRPAPILGREERREQRREELTDRV